MRGEIIFHGEYLPRPIEEVVLPHEPPSILARIRAIMRPRPLSDHRRCNVDEVRDAWCPARSLKWRRT